MRTTSPSGKNRQRARPPRGGDPLSIVRSYVFAPRGAGIAAGVFAVLAVASGAGYLLQLHGMPGGACFPFDAAWIPAAFARTLRETGAYALAGGMPGSTAAAPLYVLALAALGSAVSDPVTAAVGIGAAAFAAAAVGVFALGRRLFAREQWLAVAAAALFLLTPRMESVAASGTETMPLTALLVWTAAAWHARRPAAFFVLAALALWTRPETLILLVAAVVHHLYHRRIAHGEAETDARPVPRVATVVGAAIFGLALAGYAVFNVVTGGSPLPACVPASFAYYAGAAAPGYAGAVLVYFASRTGAPLVLFLAAGIVLLAVDLARRRRNPLLLGAAFAVGLVLAYGIALPVLLDDGRLLAPAVPFALLLGVWGLRAAAQRVARAFPLPGMGAVAHGGTVIVLLAAAGIGAASWSGERSALVHAAARERVRTVAAAEWIAGHTPADAIVAVHETGAMAYFSHRTLEDITGVQSPPLRASAGDLRALDSALRAAKVSYIATLRDRFEVVNVNPLFSSDPSSTDVLEVFRYEPGRTHIMAQRASVLNAEAARLMQAERDVEALGLLRQSFGIDPLSSRTVTLAGIASLRIRDTASAVQFLRHAVELHPDFGGAMVPLGDIYTAQGKYADAIDVLGRALQANPRMASAAQSLRRARSLREEDSLRALGYRISSFTTTH